MAQSEMTQHQMQHSFTQYSEQKNSSSLSRQERVAGIVSLLEGGVTKKQPKVIEHAKKCPTKWAKQATMNNINLPLFAWAAVTEIEASLSGRSEAMSEGTMIGKMRHLKNVLEVCCLNSTAGEFSSYGWTLARDYAMKVENEVDQRLATWQDMSVGVRTATVLAAQMENPRKSEQQPQPPKKPPPARGAKETCTTYNKCTTEGKCEYEVQHPDRSCLKKHECSWCRANKGQSWRHQVWKCKCKESAGQGGN
jgi:hypothetical protein